MVVIAYPRVKDFYTIHPSSKDSLNNWFRITSLADWSNFHEAKQTFNSVDAVGNDRYVFNIRGNEYRLIAMIFFNTRTVFIRWIGTHSEYDKLKDCSQV